MTYPQTSFAPANALQHQAVLKLSQEWSSLDAETSAPETTTPSPAPTLEQIRSVLTDLSRNGKNVEVKALLNKYGAKSLNQLAPTHFAAVLAEGGAL